MLKTGSNLADINQFQSHTAKIIIAKLIIYHILAGMLYNFTSMARSTKTLPNSFVHYIFHIHSSMFSLPATITHTKHILHNKVKKTRITTSISSREQKKSRRRRLKQHLLKSRITKPYSHIFIFFNIFIFSMTDTPTDKVNYILHARWYRESSKINQPSIMNNISENRS